MGSGYPSVLLRGSCVQRRRSIIVALAPGQRRTRDTPTSTTSLLGSPCGLCLQPMVIPSNLNLSRQSPAATFLPCMLLGVPEFPQPCSLLQLPSFTAFNSTAWAPQQTWTVPRSCVPVVHRPPVASPGEILPSWPLPGWGTMLPVYEFWHPAVASREIQTQEQQLYRFAILLLSCARVAAASAVLGLSARRSPGGTPPKS